MKNSILIFIVLSLAPILIMGQGNSADHKISIEIPEVALLGLVSGGSTDVGFVSYSPDEAGNSVTFADSQKDKEIWINYSSIVSDNSQNRKIVAVVQGDIPAGMQLMVRASEAEGKGSGNLGHPLGVVKLSNEPTDIIVDIGSCFTGKGISNGHYLTYQLNFAPNSEQYSQLVQEQKSFNVIYTLTDRN